MNPRHPARFPDKILAAIRQALEQADGCKRVLDPFAGTGRIHELRQPSFFHPGFDTVGVELQQKWARLHPGTARGDATQLPLPDASFDAIATSPTYGNRMADHHEARDDSFRNTYHHAHGERLHANNSGAMQWGPEYRALHEKAWPEAVRVLRRGGVFVLNIKDHDRGGIRQRVSEWHVTTLEALGLTLCEQREVDTGGLRHGANTDNPYPEQLYILR